MDIPFLACSALLLGFILFCAAAGRPREGLCYGWLSTLVFFPSWMEMKLGGALTLDLRTEAVVAGLIALFAIGRSLPRIRWSTCDVLVLLLVVSQWYSNYRNGDWGLTTAPTIAQHWILPYLVGRYFFGNRADLQRVGWFLGVAVVFLAVFGLLEMVSGLNPAMKLTGQAFAFDAEQGERFGFHRARGVAAHPIFFGLTMVMLLPWCLELARRARAGEMSRFNLMLPAVAILGAATSLSRGPLLAALCTIAFYVFLRMPRLRVALLVTVIGGSLLAWSVNEAVMEDILSAVGEVEESSTDIVIKGEVVKYTGTRHRVLQFKAYEEAIANAGPFGFGERLLVIPVLYPVHPLFWSIDCHYLLFFLQNGWVGLALFLLLALLTLYRLARVAWDPSGPLAALAAGHCASLAAVNVALASVYFPYTFLAIWLFSAGLASNLEALQRDALEEEALADEDFTEHEALDVPEEEEIHS